MYFGSRIYVTYDIFLWGQLQCIRNCFPCANLGQISLLLFMCFMFILVYLGMNGGCTRIGHFFFLLLGFVTIASILVCIAQADKAGDP